MEGRPPGTLKQYPALIRAGPGRALSPAMMGRTLPCASGGVAAQRRDSKPAVSKRREKKKEEKKAGNELGPRLVETRELHARSAPGERAALRVRILSASSNRADGVRRGRPPRRLCRASSRRGLAPFCIHRGSQCKRKRKPELLRPVCRRRKKTSSVSFLPFLFDRTNRIHRFTL